MIEDPFVFTLEYKEGLKVTGTPGAVASMITCDIWEILSSQLPRVLQDKLKITVKADPFMLRTEVVFTDDREREFRCFLEEEEIDGRRLCCRIPEDFITHLCAVV